MADYPNPSPGSTPTYNPHLPLAGDEENSTQQVENMSLGYGTKQVWLENSDSDTTNTFFAIQAVNDTIISSITGSSSTGLDKLLTKTIPAGLINYGTYNGIVVTSGLLCCYYKG